MFVMNPDPRNIKYINVKVTEDRMEKGCQLRVKLLGRC